MVVSSMIGVGVFASLGFQLEVLPSAFPILLLWLLGGVVSYCGAMCYAELAAQFPESGGEYHFLRVVLHPFPAFLAGWISIVAGFAAPIASLAIAFAGYARQLGIPVPTSWMAVGIILAIALLHSLPLRTIGGYLAITTFIKVALIFAFLLAAFFTPTTRALPFAPRDGDGALIFSSGFAVSFVYVMFAYSGWNGAAYIAGEIRNAQRALPLAFGIGLAVVTFLYIALNAVFLWRTPWELLVGRVEAGVFAAEAMFGAQGGKLMAALIAIGMLATMGAYTWSGSRVGHRIGLDFFALAFLARTNRHGAPVIALALQTGLALILALTGSFDQIVNFLMSLLLLCSLLTVLCVPIARHRYPGLERPFKTPLYPLPVIIYAVACLWMLAHQISVRPLATAMSALALLLGAVVYCRVRR